MLFLLRKLHSKGTEISFLLFGPSICHFSLLFGQVFVVVPQVVDAFIQFFEVFVDLADFFVLKSELFSLFWLFFGDDRDSAFIFGDRQRLGLGLRTDGFEGIEVISTFFWFVSDLNLLLFFLFLNAMIVPVLIFVNSIQIDAFLQFSHVFPANWLRWRRRRLSIRVILRGFLL